MVVTPYTRFPELTGNTHLKYIIKPDGPIFVNIYFCQNLRDPVHQGIIWNLLDSLYSIFQFLYAHQFFTEKRQKQNHNFQLY